MSESQFEEGEEYDFQKLPDSEMTNSGHLELIGDGSLVGKFGNYIVSFEWSKVRCTKVTHVDDVGSEVDD